ncbi:MAG: hypothetical protein KF773_22580 [Deltaproteobacteria bacterium]|nr:hypothetical protein [Deltaproteobacteria bacterium]MCW5806986.1 hypothetical protein [Deltaproteobacteria bacterium]
MSRITCLVLSLCLGLAAGACTDDSSGITSEEVVCPPASTLNYNNFGQAFVTTHCLSCHAAKERPLLGSQAAVTANRAAIIREAVISTRMPEDADMAIEDRRQLGEWLACGAP